MLFPDVGLVSAASLCSASFQQSGFLLQAGEVQPRFSIILWLAFSPEFRAQNKKGGWQPTPSKSEKCQADVTQASLSLENESLMFPETVTK